VSDKSSPGILTRLRAIRALMDDRAATNGERAAAAAMYEKLLRTHGLTEQAVLETKTSILRFEAVNEAERKLLLQVVSKVTNNLELSYWDRNPYDSRNPRKSSRYLWFELTPLNAKEVALLYAHYRKELADEMKKLVSAFILANDIYPDKSDSDGSTVMTPEKRQELLRILKMANVITPQPVPGKDPLLGDGKDNAGR